MKDSEEYSESSESLSDSDDSEEPTVNESSPQMEYQNTEETCLTEEGGATPKPSKKTNKSVVVSSGTLKRSRLERSRK